MLVQSWAEGFDAAICFGTFPCHVRGKSLSWWGKFWCCADVPKDQRLQAIKAAIMLLPDENREVLQTLLYFLSDVTAAVKENQMTPTNLAVCLAPSLFHLNTLKRENSSPRYQSDEMRMHTLFRLRQPTFLFRVVPVFLLDSYWIKQKGVGPPSLIAPVPPLLLPPFFSALGVWIARQSGYDQVLREVWTRFWERSGFELRRGKCFPWSSPVSSVTVSSDFLPAKDRADLVT